MMIFAAAFLVPLMGPDSQTIYVNPDKVVSMRQVRERHKSNFGPGIECMLEMSDGKLIGVGEECDAVLMKLFKQMAL